MEINKLIEAKGYKNSTVRICEFLGFSDGAILIHEFDSIEKRK